MTEKTGKVTLDDTHYPGEDLYCDGAVEDEILEIVRNNEEAAYGRIIEDRQSWRVLSHLSHLRENIVDWIPLRRTDKVLEVGSGCGAITGALAGKAGSVTCIELSRKRSLINACRHSQCANVTIKLGNFQDIEPELPCDYDYIFLIGVFEYAQSYIGGDEPFQTFLTIMKKHLAPDGRLVIAIENRFGLKYWAGCREDHLGTYFDGIEGYPRGGYVRTFRRRALEELCQSAGLSDYSFYYPYPDYKFMTCLYSDARLPKVGELSDNMRNFDRDRMLLFDEKNVFDSLIREEIFPQFSNSYVLVVGAPLQTVYARFSNDRAPEYAIRTEIRQTKDGMEVRKIPLTKEAETHVGKLAQTCHILERDYEGSGLCVNRCVMDQAEAVFEYLPGRTLEELLDECLDRGDQDGFRRLFDRYCELVRYPQSQTVYNFDMIFSNFILTDDLWHLIDYEWISEAEIPAEELIARALYCYGIGSEKRKEICMELIRENGGAARHTAEGGNAEMGGACKSQAGMDDAWDEASLRDIIQREREFQKYSTGDRMSMTEIRNAIGQPVVPAVSLMHRYMEERLRKRVQIYEDYGAGFSEEASYFLPESYQERETIVIELERKPGLRALRIDPSMDYCIVRVGTLTAGGRIYRLSDKNIKLNGNLISDNTIVFDTQDPIITILELV